ncbi:hypothetical protein OROGR_006324 [Orobanche gracilis]
MLVTMGQLKKYLKLTIGELLLLFCLGVHGTKMIRTRSRANKIADTRDKEAASGLVLEEENDAAIVPVGEKLKDRKTKGPGSMAAYLELRDRQKLQAEIQISQTQPQSEHVQPSSDTPHEPEKRKRGKTRMDHVHTRKEKKEIKLNNKFQPISDTDKTLSELSLFLGTTVRDFVSLTCVSWKEVPDKDLLWQYVKEKYIIPEEGFKWVNKVMADQFRTYKSRIKKDHYNAYKSDEERLKHRPRQIPLADFKILLKYWGDENVQATADRNKKARSHIVETHTTGPRSFAQVCNKLETKRALERMSVDAEELLEPLQPLCDADIYVETRKRDEKREYKLPTYIVQKKIDDVKTILEAGGSIEAANKVVRGEKEHSPSWLVGRLIRKKQSKEKSATSTTSGASNQYIADLTEKIRAELTQEMDDKVDRKVREMMKKLADKNPALKFDIDATDISSGNDNSP